jgi:hypothetical protein
VPQVNSVVFVLCYSFTFARSIIHTVGGLILETVDFDAIAANRSWCRLGRPGRRQIGIVAVELQRPAHQYSVVVAVIVVVVEGRVLAQIVVVARTFPHIGNS